VLAVLERLTSRRVLDEYEHQRWSVRPDVYRDLLRAQIRRLLNDFVLGVPDGRKILDEALREAGNSCAT